MCCETTRDTRPFSHGYAPHYTVKQPGTHNLSTLGMHPTTLWNSQGHTTFLPWVCTPLHCETARDTQPFYLGYAPHYTVKQPGTCNLTLICTPLHCETASDTQPLIIMYPTMLWNSQWHTTFGNYGPHYVVKLPVTHNLPPLPPPPPIFIYIF